MTLLQSREQTSLLRFGRRTGFIRWHQARDGRWYPEILQGRYDHVDSQGWWIDVDGDLLCLPGHIWSIYRD